MLLLACWLLAFGCQHSEPMSTGPESAGPSEEPYFRDVAADLSIRFVDAPRNREEVDLPAVMGSGCAMLDFNRDDRPDFLLLASDSTADRVALYRQNADGTFQECSADLGLDEVSGTGVAVGDANNDGWPDLYFTSVQADSLWINQDGQSFADQTAAAGIDNLRWGVAACWLDYDRDGWLDVFVTNYVDYAARPCTRLGGGDRDFCNPGLFDRTPDVLYRNVSVEAGRLQFEDVSTRTGISAGRSAGLAVTAADLTRDGQIDLYVASDQHPNLLWVNDGGQFTEQAAARGCDVDLSGRPQASMGIALADVTGDEHEELLVAHLDGETHAVYSGQPTGLFTDECRMTGIGELTRPFTGFGIAAVDFDLDGRAEILTANGRVRRDESAEPSQQDFWKPYQQPLQLLNSDDASSGRYATVAAVKPSTLSVARGIAVGDFDRDGGIDALVSTVGEPAIVLHNQNRRTGTHRALRLRVVDPNLGGRSCPGASLSVFPDQQAGRDEASLQLLHQLTFQPCQSYGSTHLDELLIAVPVSTTNVQVDVVWPHGDVVAESFRMNLPPESSAAMDVVLRRGDGVVKPVDAAASAGAGSHGGSSTH